MAAIARRTLLALLQERAREVGADLRFQTGVDLEDLDGYDLVVAADGANSRIRSRLAGAFGPTAETATAKFIWFGTTYMFEGLTFVHERGPHGVFAVHGYPISDEVSTFIIETDEASWRAAGLDAFDVDQPPGPSDLKSKQYLEALFADQIDGHPLLVNNSRWGNFRTRRAASWRHGRVVLLGDAAHTAHFSVGSGTKMAMEDAIALAAALHNHGDDVDAALATYEATARPSVEKIQGSARPSLSWWEHFGRYHDTLEPWQFAFHFLTRSISAGRLARRAPDFVDAARRGWASRHGASPLATPLTLGGAQLGGRVLVVAPDGDGARAMEPAGTGWELRLPAAAPEETGTSPWGLWLPAPASEQDLPQALDRLRAALRAGPLLVAVHGGSSLTRTLLSEEARLIHGIPTLLVDDDMTRDQAETALLSGRTDLVGGARATVGPWGDPA
jgi:anthraniloyl-CoA monooxygenase